MRRVYWRLRYDRDVIAKLYQLRERGFVVHRAIRELMYQQQPWTGSLVIGERAGWYEFEVHGFFVGFYASTDPEDVEPTLIILYVHEILV
ncbi:MAG: hypothetical protein U0X20_17000 [Caldilineaceae bacterium]